MLFKMRYVILICFKNKILIVGEKLFDKIQDIFRIKKNRD